MVKDIYYHASDYFYWRKGGWGGGCTLTVKEVGSRNPCTTVAGDHLNLLPLILSSWELSKDIKIRVCNRSYGKISKILNIVFGRHFIRTANLFHVTLICILLPIIPPFKKLTKILQLKWALNTIVFSLTTITFHCEYRTFCAVWYEFFFFLQLFACTRMNEETNFLFANRVLKYSWTKYTYHSNLALSKNYVA